MLWLKSNCKMIIFTKIYSNYTTLWLRLANILSKICSIFESFPSFQSLISIRVTVKLSFRNLASPITHKLWVSKRTKYIYVEAYSTSTPHVMRVTDTSPTGSPVSLFTKLIIKVNRFIATIHNRIELTPAQYNTKQMTITVSSIGQPPISHLDGGELWATAHFKAPPGTQNGDPPMTRLCMLPTT